MNTTRDLCMPPTSIKVSLRYLYEESSSEFVNNILQQIRGINNLLTDLESISRTLASSGRLSLADHELSTFLKETISRLGDYTNGKRIMLRWVDEPAFVTICLDRGKMATILRDLLMTSTDNIDQGGETSLSIPCNTQNWELRPESEDNGLLKKKF